MPAVVVRARSLLRLDPLGGGGNRFLSGSFAPLRTEHEALGPFEVDGALPPALDGVLVRNGPNPATVSDPAAHAWCTGDGMVHAIELSGGRAVAHRNRWVRTRTLAEQVGTRAPEGPVEPVDGPANANVVLHAGRLLALSDGGLPHRLDRRLRTRGLEDFDAMITSPLSPLPKVDPVSGGMAMIGYDCFGPPFLRYHELDASGSVIHSTAVDVARPSLQHDFAMTATRVVFLDLPVRYDVELARRGSPLPYRWDPDTGARLGVLDRGAPGTDTAWFPLEPRFAFHVMNAHDAGAKVVVDVCRHEEAFGPRGHLGAVLERWEIDPGAGRVTLTQLDNLAVEWPRVDDRVVGRPYRFGYCATPPVAPGVAPSLVRYDLAGGLRSVWSPGEGRRVSEPVFVPDPDGTAEDEGFVLTVVGDPDGEASRLVVLDASSFGAPPVASVQLPFRVPDGFHGTWLPREALVLL